MNINIGDKIKELRTKSNIIQKDLAKSLNLSQQTISLYESNRRQPNYIILVEIADYFGVTTDFLLGRSKETIMEKNKEVLSYKIKKEIRKEIKEIIKERNKETIIDINKLFDKF